MNPEAQEYYNIAGWLKDKVNYNRISKFNTNKRRQVLHGQIWYCDMGYNIGTEKNKLRPVLVMSNNRINNSEKVVIICITDACLLYTSPSPRDRTRSRMPSSA